MITFRRPLAAWRQRHETVATRRDAGTTMIEVFTAMVLMTICGAIFTGAIISLFKAANQAQAITTSGQQNNQAYQTLDRSVRYASAISTPGKSTVSGGTGDWYVELRNTTDGSERCTQLRVDITSGVLQRRTWKPGDGTDPKAATWRALSSGLTNGAVAATSDDRPFVLATPTSTARHQVLVFTLISRAGLTTQPVSSRSNFTLTALNSSLPVPAGDICQQAGRP